MTTTTQRRQAPPSSICERCDHQEREHNGDGSCSAELLSRLSGRSRWSEAGDWRCACLGFAADPVPLQTVEVHTSSGDKRHLMLYPHKLADHPIYGRPIALGELMCSSGGHGGSLFWCITPENLGSELCRLCRSNAYRLHADGRLLVPSGGIVGLTLTGRRPNGR